MTEYGMMDNESGELLALRGVDVSTRITGLLASTALVQKYKNDTDTNLELSYTFPVPVSGTLLSFAVAIGERKFEGQVIPRAQAEAKYEETIGEGNSAFRLQEVRAGMYNATLGNVMPGEEVAITLSYAEPLSWNGKSIRYRLPTTIAPRYGEPSGMQPWQRPETSLAAEYPLAVTVSIAGELSQSAVSCPSHKVSMKLQSDVLGSGAHQLWLAQAQHWIAVHGSRGRQCESWFAPSIEYCNFIQLIIRGNTVWPSLKHLEELHRQGKIQ